jgi:hypothetical protein
MAAMTKASKGCTLPHAIMTTRPRTDMATAVSAHTGSAAESSGMIQSSLTRVFMYRPPFLQVAHFNRKPLTRFGMRVSQ